MEENCFQFWISSFFLDASSYSFLLLSYNFLPIFFMFFFFVLIKKADSYVLSSAFSKRLFECYSSSLFSRRGITGWRMVDPLIICPPSSITSERDLKEDTFYWICCVLTLFELYPYISGIFRASNGSETSPFRGCEYMCIFELTWRTASWIIENMSGKKWRLFKR